MLAPFTQEPKQRYVVVVGFIVNLCLSPYRYFYMCVHFEYAAHGLDASPDLLKGKQTRRQRRVYTPNNSIDV